MQEITGDIWKKAHFFRDIIVIPTTIGWTRSGLALAGRGLAKQAALRFPSLEQIYGEHCQAHRAQTPVMTMRFGGLGGGRWLCLLPTKPLREDHPEMSWQGKADLKLIERGLRQLQALKLPLPSKRSKVYVPLLGCGFGGLRRGPVRELMDAILTDERFARVRLERKRKS